MKFIHLADVHLGAEPESGTPLGPIRKAEIWDAFRDVIEACEKEKIDLLLIPGDLCHGQPLLRDVKEIDGLFRRLTHTKVVMIAGNHDCLLKTSHYYDVDFPEHVSFLMDFYGDSVFLPELNVQVHGLSYDVKQISEPRYNALRITHPERINIMIAHGNLTGADKSIPVSRDRIEEEGFDYAALGHIHTRYEISSRIAYTGGFEPLERKETGKKGYIRGEIIKHPGEESLITWEFVPHAKREYVQLDLVTTPETTELSLCEELVKVMREKGLQHMYLVTLTGTRAREIRWNREAVRTLVERRGGMIVEFTDKTAPDFSLEQLREEQKDTLVGRFIASCESAEDKEIGELALQYGLQALLSEE